MSVDLPRLYSFVRCPYAIRARLALTYCGLTYIHREVDLKDKPHHMISLSPKATVPVLFWNDGRVFDESIDIVRWATANHLPAGWRENQKVDEDTEIQELLEKLASDFIPQLNRIKYPERFEDSDRRQQEIFLKKYLQHLGKKMRSNHHIADKPSYADILLVPLVRQLRGAETDWFMHNAPENIQAWLQSWVEVANFTHIMQKYSIWQPGEESVIVSPKRT